MGRRRPPVDQALPVTGLAVAIRYISAAPEALDNHRLLSRSRRPASGPAIAREAGMATGDRPRARWTAVLRRQPARVAGGRPEGGYTDMFEIICRDCGDDPSLDYLEVPPRLQLVRGPYSLAAGVAVYEQHVGLHQQLDSTIG